MPDLFSGAQVNGYHYDLFETKVDTFRWIVAVFSGDGASWVIRRAKRHELATYYSIRINRLGDYVSLWKDYLFVEFRKGITIDLCHSTAKFLKVVSVHDEEGLLQPVLLRRSAIYESLRLMTQGRFDEKIFMRRFYGRGSLVMVIEGPWIDHKVTLEIDVTPEMKGSAKVPVSINGVKAKIELHKLSL
jgi:hypothetical protein